MPYPTMPAGVVSGELIESAWGNLVAEALEATDQIRGGNPHGGVVAAGTQAEVASIALPQGIWVVHYQVLVVANGDWKAVLRGFVGGAFQTDVYGQGQWDGVDANHSMTMTVVADFTAVPAGSSVTFNLLNNSTFPLTTYPDASNHRIAAMSGRLP